MPGLKIISIAHFENVDRSFYVIAIVIIIALLFFGFLLLIKSSTIPLGILFTVGQYKEKGQGKKRNSNFDVAPGIKKKEQMRLIA